MQLRNAFLIIVCCLGSFGCASEADKKILHDSLSRHAACVRTTCFRTGRVGAGPYDAMHAYRVECLGQRFQVYGAKQKNAPLQKVTSSTLTKWDSDMESVCVTSFEKGNREFCAELRKKIEDAEHGHDVPGDMRELLEQEYARSCPRSL